MKDELEEKLFSEWQGFCEKHKISNIAVACSGHADSIALFHLLRKHFGGQSTVPIRDSRLSPIALIHINYNLRGEDSRKDQAFVEALADQHQVECQVFSPTNPPKSGLQKWAREYRYERFQELADQGWTIALAHHLDDAAENVLFRMSRGASAESLVGMHKWRPPFWRPLLSLAKAELVQYLARQGLQHRQDLSNDTIDYSRNRIRHRVLPELEGLFPKAAQRIAAVGTETMELSQYTRQILSAELEELGQEIPVEFLTSKPQGVAFLVLDLMFSRAAGKWLQLSRSLFNRILVKINDPESAKKSWSFNVAGGLIFKFHKGKISAHASTTPSTFFHGQENFHVEEKGI